MSMPNGSAPASSPIVSTDVALSVIQEVVNKVTGKSVPIARDTRMDRYFIELSGTDDLDYLDLSFKLDAKLGVKITKEDWAYLSGGTPKMSKEEWEAKYAEFFTFGRLADVVASRARLGIVRPVTILGSTSLSAGAFQSIERIAFSINPEIERFAPSTPILDRLSGSSLVIFWARVLTISGSHVPPLHKTRLIRFLESAYLFAVWTLVIGLVGGTGGAILCAAFGVHNPIGTTGLFTGWIGVLGAIGTGIFAVALHGFHRLIRALEPREVILPHDIRTFRDLAELISGDRGGWCTKCDYDLTGLTSDICPECGTPISPNPLQWAKSEPKS